ncbi:MAG TPA: anthrone oxygenase family protein [Gemmatimonadales bacterium]|nr:anthrone oxygenase family protein [Gemmatimonadales bacterium]
MSTVLLWLFVINLGVAFGAGLYEHRIVVPRWLRPSAGTGVQWDAAAARQDDTGRRFWVFVTTGPLTLLTLASLVAAWRSAGAVRSWWLAAAWIALADRLFTFSYFIPTIVKLMRGSDAANAAGRARRWARLNYVRHTLVLAAWLASLRAFALFYAQPH